MQIKSALRNFERNIRHAFGQTQFKQLLGQMYRLQDHFKQLLDQMYRLHDISLSSQVAKLQEQSINPLNKYGNKCFSQSDEDGITIEILRRIGLLNDGVYAEFGVGDGTENNTLILAALGWKGFWVGGEDLKPNISNNDYFQYLKKWITIENIVELANEGLCRIGCDKVDVISLDLDGNDIYFVEKILSFGMRPKLFIVEYNAKFPPPIEFQITYDSHHIWKGDDYFGASLSSFDKLFTKHNYQLVCCNLFTGTNAFFMDREFSDKFIDIPSNINTIFMPPRYWLYKQFGHPNSITTIEKIFSRNQCPLKA